MPHGYIEDTVIVSGTTGAYESGGNLEGINNKIPADPAKEGGNLANVATYTNRIPSQGTAVMAASLPVTIASDQSNVYVLGTVTVNASSDLNTNQLALEAGGHLNIISSRTPTLGQATKAASIPVAIASDQGTHSVFAVIHSDYIDGAVACANITISNTDSHQSAALSVGKYMVTANVDVCIRTATNPTAVVTDAPCWGSKGDRIGIQVVASDKIAAISHDGASTGVVYISKATGHS